MTYFEPMTTVFLFLLIFTKTVPKHKRFTAPADGAPTRGRRTVFEKIASGFTARLRGPVFSAHPVWRDRWKRRDGP